TRSYGDWSSDVCSSDLVDQGDHGRGNAHLISKVYFPRLVIPAATAVVALVDFAINFVMLVLIMAWYGFLPGWQVVFLPGFVLLRSEERRVGKEWGFEFA